MEEHRQDKHENGGTLGCLIRIPRCAVDGGYGMIEAKIGRTRVMASDTLERRVTAVERELAQLKKRLAKADGRAGAPRWEKIFGSFADSEGFEEAVRLGREYRESLRPKEQKPSK